MCYCGCSAENSNGECKLTKNYICDYDEYGGEEYDEYGGEEYDEYGGEDEIGEEEQDELDSAAEDRYFGK